MEAEDVMAVAAMVEHGLLPSSPFTISDEPPAGVVFRLSFTDPNA